MSTWGPVSHPAGSQYSPPQKGCLTKSLFIHAFQCGCVCVGSCVHTFVPTRTNYCTFPFLVHIVMDSGEVHHQSIFSNSDKEQALQPCVCIRWMVNVQWLNCIGATISLCNLPIPRFCFFSLSLLFIIE